RAEQPQESSRTRRLIQTQWGWGGWGSSHPHLEPPPVPRDPRRFSTRLGTVNRKLDTLPRSFSSWLSAICAWLLRRPRFMKSPNGDDPRTRHFAPRTSHLSLRTSPLPPSHFRTAGEYLLLARRTGQTVTSLHVARGLCPFTSAHRVFPAG